MSNPATRGELAAYFATQGTYDRLYDDYLRRGVNQEFNPEDTEMRRSDERRIGHYFQVGEDALRLVVRSLVAHGRAVPATILDLPSGSGRVTRHLRSFFPMARIVASDLYERHVDFCVRTFGVEGVLAAENPDDMSLAGSFDVIFCGSLLTHLPEPGVHAALRLFRRLLSPTGLAIVTLHGPHSEYIQKHKWKYLDDRLFAIAEKEVHRSGFGYVDYAHETRGDFSKQAAYGIALVRPHWMVKLLEAEADIRLLGYAERDWDDHQDVLVFGRPGINA